MRLANKYEVASPLWLLYDSQCFIQDCKYSCLQDELVGRLPSASMKVDFKTFTDKQLQWPSGHVGAVAKWLNRQIADAEIQGSSPNHGMEELNKSSFEPLLHPTQV